MSEGIKEIEQLHYTSSIGDQIFNQDISYNGVAYSGVALTVEPL